MRYNVYRDRKEVKREKRMAGSCSVQILDRSELQLEDSIEFSFWEIQPAK
jgi:hypothetical protein